MVGWIEGPALFIPIVECTLPTHLSLESCKVFEIREYIQPQFNGASYQSYHMACEAVHGSKKKPHQWENWHYNLHLGGSQELISVQVLHV